MPSSQDTLLGYPIPFPKSDLIVALIAVASFIPAIIIGTRIVQGVLGLFRGKAKAQ